MRFLADESCDFAVVRALRAAGHDVLAVAEAERGADDRRVIELARSDSRLLLTEDRDFGQLVFAAAKMSSGVLFVRYPALARGELTPAILKIVAERGDSLYGAFVVVAPRRIRVIRLPSSTG